MLDRIDIAEIVRIARLAGDEIMDVYRSEIAVTAKDDRSPLTEADRRANTVILNELQELYPDIPFISEESKETAYAERKDWPYFWLIDPLDGTKEFIKRNGEFTVNIALVENGVPVLGVVYLPEPGICFHARKGMGCIRIDADGNESRMDIRNTPYDQLDAVRVVASRSHLSDEVLAFVDELKADGKEVEFISAGSSLKFCLLAEGKADVYPRFGPTMEWDTGAAQVVATETGHSVVRWPEKTDLTYNKENLLNPFFLVA